jgi:hypothetical protein
MAAVRVKIQPRESIIDGVIDALAKAWNEQERDRSAAAYFAAWHRMLRAKVLRESLYRYPEVDRKFLARQLRDLADGIYEAIVPLV